VNEPEPRRPPSWKGEIWNLPPVERARIVAAVCEKLVAAYGLPRFGNPDDPLDDLVYIILSNRASPSVAGKLFAAVKERYPRWEDVLESQSSTLTELIKPGGLSAKKSAQIASLLQKIKAEFGACDLGSLRGRPESEVESQLVSLPGVSLKVAKCVMLYTLNAEVLPVDAHVHRVTGRLGWTRRKRADQCHEELEALVSRERRYAFHVDCIAHGRAICRANNPACERCPVNPQCSFYKRTAKS
jgi:endonuclease III